MIVDALLFSVLLVALYVLVVAETGYVLPGFVAEALGRHLERKARRGDLPIYFHLPGYMLRWWLFGDRSKCRNTERKRGATPSRLPGYEWLSTYVCARLHNILTSDRDRAKHDHPCPSVSVILRSGYWEVMTPPPMPNEFELARYNSLLDILSQTRPTDTQQWIMAHYNVFWRAPGQVVFRSATTAHRIVLPDGTDSLSIFVQFKKSNSWGFYPNIDRGDVHKTPWREYLNIAESAEEGVKIPRSLRVK